MLSQNQAQGDSPLIREGDVLSKKLLSRAARMSRFEHFAD
jgi:hypothetical protein